MNKENLLKEINELLDYEHAEPVDFTQPLVESGVDSFGLVTVLLEIDNKYELWSKEEFSKQDFSILSTEHIYNLILKKANNESN